MRRLWIAVVVAGAISLHAQEAPDPVADAKSATEPPISFSFGPQEDGGFGVVVLIYVTARGSLAAAKKEARRRMEMNPPEGIR